MAAKIKKATELYIRSVTLRAGTIDEPGRSVEAVFSTETPARVYDWRSGREVNEVLIAEGCQFGDDVRMLDNHYRSSVKDVLGSGTDIRVANNEVIGRLTFADDDGDAENAWKKVRQNHIKDVSVGYMPTVSIDIEPGKSEDVGGRTFDGGTDGLRVTTEWELREISLTPMGADPNAKIREEYNPAPVGVEGKKTEVHSTMNEKLRAVLTALGLRAEADEALAWGFYNALDGEQKRKADEVMGDSKPPAKSEPAPGPTRSAPGPVAVLEPIAAPKPIDVAEVVRQALADDRKRAADIRALAGDDVPSETVNRAAVEGWDVNRASREFLGSIREAKTGQVPTGVGVHVAPVATRDALASGLAQRVGIDLIDPKAPEAKRKEQEQSMELGNQFRDMSLFDICRAANALSGAKDPRTGTRPHTRGEHIRAAVSGSALTNIFTTSVNAKLMQAYLEAPDTTGLFVREVDVADFKTNERIGFGKSGALQKLARGNEAKHAAFSDEKEEYKICRYASQFVVDEQDIIDDNMSALTSAPTEMGPAAKRLRPDLVYSELLANGNLSDAVALFAVSTHANLTTAALASSALQAAVVAMAQQKYDGVRLNLRPNVLIVPPDLEFTARALLHSAELFIKGDTDGVAPSRNVIADLNLNLIVEGRIDAVGVTNPSSGTALTGSATNWFLAASPVSARTIEVGYLAGTGRAPQLRSFVLDKGQWGIGWDIKMDIGVAALDWRGMHKSTGAG